MIKGEPLPYVGTHIFYLPRGRRQLYVLCPITRKVKERVTSVQVQKYFRKFTGFGSLPSLPPSVPPMGSAA